MSIKKSCKTCASCGGSGQINYFQGVSRFLLSAEECPECNGLGHTVIDDDQNSGDSGEDKNNGSSQPETKKG